MSENDVLTAEAGRPRRRARPTPDPVDALAAADEVIAESDGEPAVWVPPAVAVSALADGDESAVAAVAEALVTAGFLDGPPGDGETFRLGYARLRRYLGHGPSASYTGPDADSLKWLSLRTGAFTVTSEEGEGR